MRNAIQVIHGDTQHGHGGGVSGSAELQLLRAQADGEQSSSETVWDLQAEVWSAAVLVAGGYAAVARLTGYSETTVRSWADPKNPEKYGHWNPILEHLLPVDVGLAMEAERRMQRHRRSAHTPGTMERAALKLEAVQGKLADARLTNEPAAVVRPIVRELVEAAVRIDATFSTCPRCHAENFAACPTCESCGLTRT